MNRGVYGNPFGRGKIRAVQTVVNDYSKPGTFTWRKPGGVSHIMVILVGGGGGGGGGASAVSAALPIPTPTLPFLSPRTIAAEKLKRRPPAITRATRRIPIIF